LVNISPIFKHFEKIAEQNKNKLFFLGGVAAQTILNNNALAVSPVGVLPGKSLLKNHWSRFSKF
jgi:hypothetical protein